MELPGLPFRLQGLLDEAGIELQPIEQQLIDRLRAENERLRNRLEWVVLVVGPLVASALAFQEASWAASGYQPTEFDHADHKRIREVFGIKPPV